MVEKLLKKASLKKTKQRFSILTMIEKSNKPLTADEIFNLLKDNRINIDLSTVYRTLNILCYKNILLKILKSDGTASYQINDSLHNHYITCYECHSSVLIDKCPIQEISLRISKETGYYVTGHSLQLIGLCPDCLEKMSNEKDPQ